MNKNMDGQSSKRTWVMAIVIVVISLIAAGGVYAWKSKNITVANGDTNVTKTILSAPLLTINGTINGSDSSLSSIDQTWNLYTNNKYGFSIKVPKKMYHSYGSMCTSVDDSYRPKGGFVPVKIFENENVYISSEYFYNLTGETVRNGISSYSGCEKVTNTLLVLEDKAYSQQLSWKFVVKDVANDSELNTFVKEQYGSGCEVGAKNISTQEGVYDVSIQADLGDLGKDQCFLNYMTVLKYYPEKKEAISWDLGQSSTFAGDKFQQIVYDLEMVKSFKFIPLRTVQIYAAYDCDKLRVKNVEVPKGETQISTALKYLPGPGGTSTVEDYSKSFKVEGNIAYINWPADMSNLSNINTSCASQAFLQPIEKTLIQIAPIKTVIHSMGGSVNDFYMYMGLSCPRESVECDYDDVAISMEKSLVTIMVPENYDAYIKEMTRFEQEGGVNPLETQIFVKKELNVFFTPDIIKASAQAAAGEIPTLGGPAKASIAYLGVQNDTAYVLLDIDLDGWAGSSVSVAIIHPLVEKTLLLFPEISHVVFGYAPGAR
ncbi:MAG: hypothetical protein WCX95_04925 [Candidatus Gracilibacteria bacterium]